MTTVYFLEASVPLTKSFKKIRGGEVLKDAYPLVGNFTSHAIEVAGVADLYKGVVAHAAQGR